MPAKHIETSKQLSSSANNPMVRPYRSHKFPACDFCRRRKARCSRPIGNEPCQLCRLHKVECTQGVGVRREQPTEKEPNPKAPRRLSTHSSAASQHALSCPDVSGSMHASRQATSLGLPETPRDICLEETGACRIETLSQVDYESDTAHSTIDQGGLKRDTTENQTNHIVGPAIARDVQLLGRCLAPSGYQNLELNSSARLNSYNVVSDDERDPIVYLRVPRQRTVMPKRNNLPGFKQCETIERILDPLQRDMFSLYFDAFHPAFPILDEKSVTEAYYKDSLPCALLCEIYTVSLVSWNQSAAISSTGRPRPDIKYIWIQTVSALNEDFLSPGFSTVLSCILDLTGRPTTTMIYNSVNVGKCVALSKSLGLNRDPTGWRLEERQKDLRTRTWWGVLIHDWWSSLAHGTPPHIRPSQFDVNLPTLNSLLSNEEPSVTRIFGAECFIALCQLTEILGNLLPLIYDAKCIETKDPMKTLHSLEASLIAWEDALPEWLNPASPAFQPQSPGVLNLQISFLAVKLCLFRVCLLEASKWGGSSTSDLSTFYQSRCQDVAKKVSDFVVSLEGGYLYAFWLPYAAYHFASAATMLLRRALEAETNAASRDCVLSAEKMIRHLRRLKDDADWDLADVCLRQCEEVAGHMSDNSYLELRRQQIRSSMTVSEDSHLTIDRSTRNSDNLHTRGEKLRRETHTNQAALDMRTQIMLSGLSFTAFDNGVPPVDPSLFWNGGWHVPISDPWLVPGLDEAGNYNL